MKNVQSTLDLISKFKSNIKSKPLSKFQEAENTGRDLFRTWCFKQGIVPRFNEDEVGCFDAWAGNNNNYYEIKNKSMSFNSLKELIVREGLMIEDKKYLALREIWLQDKTKEFYFWMSFTDKIVIHQLNFEKSYKARYYDCPKTTVGDQELISKKILLVDYKDLSISDR